MNLLALKIPQHWAMCFNKFVDEEPILDQENPTRLKNWHFFTEDILQMKKMKVENGRCVIPEYSLLIDLGWYRDSDPNGAYRLELVQKDEQHIWKTLKTYSSTDRFAIKDMLEVWLQEY